MAGQRSIFGEIDVFSNLQDNSDGAMADIAMKPLPSCLVNNWHFRQTQIRSCIRSSEAAALDDATADDGGADADSRAQGVAVGRARVTG